MQDGRSQKLFLPHRLRQTPMTTLGLEVRTEKEPCVEIRLGRHRIPCTAQNFSQCASTQAMFAGVLQKSSPRAARQHISSELLTGFTCSAHNLNTSTATIIGAVPVQCHLVNQLPNCKRRQRCTCIAGTGRWKPERNLKFLPQKSLEAGRVIAITIKCVKSSASEKNIQQQSRQLVEAVDVPSVYTWICARLHSVAALAFGPVQGKTQTTLPLEPNCSAGRACAVV